MIDSMKQICSKKYMYFIYSKHLFVYTNGSLNGILFEDKKDEHRRVIQLS